MNEVNSQLRLQNKMIFIQFLISIPNTPPCSPRLTQWRKIKELTHNMLHHSDKISDISHTSRIDSQLLWVQIYKRSDRKVGITPILWHFFLKNFFGTYVYESANWKLQGMAIKTFYTSVATSSPDTQIKTHHHSRMCWRGHSLCPPV